MHLDSKSYMHDDVCCNMTILPVACALSCNVCHPYILSPCTSLISCTVQTYTLTFMFMYISLMNFGVKRLLTYSIACISSENMRCLGKKDQADALTAAPNEQITL